MIKHNEETPTTRMAYRAQTILATAALTKNLEKNIKLRWPVSNFPRIFSLELLFVTINKE